MRPEGGGVARSVEPGDGRLRELIDVNRAALGQCGPKLTAPVTVGSIGLMGAVAWLWRRMEPVESRHPAGDWAVADRSRRARGARCG